VEARTHLEIDRELCGSPGNLAAGAATVELLTTPAMAADDRGLVHGGFVFGAADYAAMLAVNDPNVVLTGAETRFLRPVRAGETVVARATVESSEGRKRRVVVEVTRGADVVMTGTFSCAVLAKHVLDG
jgi:acyl-coenzyme A thioesterase PaaI-like protein